MEVGGNALEEREEVGPGPALGVEDVEGEPDRDRDGGLGEVARARDEVLARAPHASGGPLRAALRPSQGAESEALHLRAAEEVEEAGGEAEALAGRVALGAHAGTLAARFALMRARNVCAHFSSTILYPNNTHRPAASLCWL